MGSHIERDPNTVGQIYQIPEAENCDRFPVARPGDLLLCLEHTGDCHYAWARLKWTARTESDDCSLPVHVIENYYDVDLVFSGYSLPEVWGLLPEPLSYPKMLSALIAKDNPHRASVLLPLFGAEREAYLKQQGRRHEDDQ